MADTQKNTPAAKQKTRLTYPNILRLGNDAKEIRDALAAFASNPITNTKGVIDFVTNALPVASRIVNYAAGQKKSRDQATLHSASVGIANELIRLAKAVEKFGMAVDDQEKTENIFSRK